MVALQRCGGIREMAALWVPPQLTGVDGTRAFIGCQYLYYVMTSVDSPALERQPSCRTWICLSGEDSHLINACFSESRQWGRSLSGPPKSITAGMPWSRKGIAQRWPSPPHYLRKVAVSRIEACPAHNSPVHCVIWRLLRSVSARRCRKKVRQNLDFPLAVG